MTLSVPVTARDHILGDKSASATLVEYGDYECSYCASALPIIKQVLTDFAGQLRFVFRQFPLTEIHPQAESAAEFSELAAKQRKFWEVHEALYANQSNLGTALYVEVGEVLGISERDIVMSLEGQLFATKISQDFEGGVRSGVNGTPAFFINGRRHDGSYQYEDLRMAIGAALA